jgi:hypothetical protein
MLRDDAVVGGEIETPVAFVIDEVSEKNKSSEPRWRFVSGFGGEIGIAGATKHTQVLIGGSDSLWGEVWTSHAGRLGGETVQQICGGVERAEIEA